MTATWACQAPQELADTQAHHMRPEYGDNFTDSNCKA
jgi:hypothetical protein